MCRHVGGRGAHFCGVAAVHRDLLKKTGTSCLIWPTSPEKLISYAQKLYKPKLMLMDQI